MKELGFRHFKKVAQDAKTTTLQHPQGHKIVIMHAALSPKMRGQLSELKLADGGKVSPEPQASPSPEPVEVDEFNQEAIQKDLKKIGAQYKMASGGKVEDSSKKTIGQLINYPGTAPTPSPTPEPKKDSNDYPTQYYAEGTPDAPVQEAQSSQMPAPQAPDTPEAITSDAQSQAAAEVNPEIAKKRELYNRVVNLDFGPQAPTINSPALSFGPQGEEPKVFKPDAWKQAEDMYNTQQTSAVMAQQQEQAKLVQENKARQSAGLAPLAAPSTAPDLAANNAPKLPGLAPNASTSGINPDQQPQTPPDFMGTEAMSQSYMKGLGEAKAGLYGEAQALSAQGKQEAAALQEAIPQQQLAMKTFQDHTNELAAERKHFQDDIANMHIDPNHYMSQMGTGSKIATGIGLVLGGLGESFGGGPNRAYENLQNNITRDIEAQKSELGRRETLLSANNQTFHNLKDATDMTRLMINDTTSNQLKLAAAKTMDPAAKARALQAAGKLDMDSSQMQGQIAMRKALASAAQNGRADPSRVLMAYGAQPAAFKELQDAQNAVALRDEVLSAYDQVAELNTLKNRMGGPFQTPSRIEKIKGPILDKLTKDTSGRVTPQTVQLVGDAFSKMTDNPQTTAIGRTSIEKLVSQGMHYPLLQQYGIDPMSNSGRYNKAGQSRIPEAPPVKR